MDKEKALELIQKATRYHEAQMAKIEAAINGEDVNDPPVVSKTDCKFGKWLYDDENHLREVLGTLFYDGIEVLHARWHSEYVRIFNILFKKKRRGLFSKILGTNKVDDMELDKVKLYYSELKVTTKELLKVLGSSERRISALPESKFH